jgi:hypothetical protein
LFVVTDQSVPGEIRKLKNGMASCENISTRNLIKRVRFGHKFSHAQTLNQTISAAQYDDHRHSERTDHMSIIAIALLVYGLLAVLILREPSASESGEGSGKTGSGAPLF